MAEENIVVIKNQLDVTPKLIEIFRGLGCFEFKVSLEVTSLQH